MSKMTDRELLEAAAKAAGIVIDKSPYNGGGSCNDGFDLMGNAVLDWHNGEKWNPLADDGDALRLSVKLELSPRYLLGMVLLWPERIGDQSERVIQEFYADHRDDKCAAIRRAIVRAAAEMGKE